MLSSAASARARMIRAFASAPSSNKICKTADEAVQGVANGMPRVLASQLLRDVGTGMTMLFGGFGLCGTCALCRDLFELSLTRVQAFQRTPSPVSRRYRACSIAVSHAASALVRSGVKDITAVSTTAGVDNFGLGLMLQARRSLLWRRQNPLVELARAHACFADTPD